MAAAPTTPYLRVDLDRLRRNVRERGGVGHHQPGGAAPAREDPQVARDRPPAARHGGGGLTVATLGEAEVFAQHGATDLFVAYPVYVDERAAERLRTLAERGRIAIGLDSVEGAATAGPLLAPHGVEVVVEVDSGQHRTGCPPEDAGVVAVAAARAGLTVRGVFTFPGHSYAPDGMAAAAADEARALPPHARPSSARGSWSRGRGGSTPSSPIPTRRAHRGQAGCLCLRRRPAVGARQDATGVGRADLRGHGRQPRRRPRGARLGQQGARGRPRGVQLRLGPPARPPGRADRAALGAPCGGRLRRDPAPPGRHPGRRGPEPLLRRGQPRRRPLGRGAGRLRPWPVAARGRNG